MLNTFPQSAICLFISLMKVCAKFYLLFGQLKAFLNIYVIESINYTSIKKSTNLFSPLLLAIDSKLRKSFPLPGYRRICLFSLNKYIISSLSLNFWPIWNLSWCTVYGMYYLYFFWAGSWKMPLLAHDISKSAEVRTFWLRPWSKLWGSGLTHTKQLNNPKEESEIWHWWNWWAEKF